MCNVIYSFFLYMKTMAPRIFFHVSISLLFRCLRTWFTCACLAGWGGGRVRGAGGKGWCSPLGKVLPPSPVGLPALQEVQAPSGGRWGMFRKKDAGALGAFGNQPGKLLNLFFIGCSLLIRSLFWLLIRCHFFLFSWVVAWNLPKESEWYKNMKMCCLAGKVSSAGDCIALRRAGPAGPCAAPCPSQPLVLLCVLGYPHIICELSAPGLQTPGPGERSSRPETHTVPGHCSWSETSQSRKWATPHGPPRAVSQKIAVAAY